MAVATRIMAIAILVITIPTAVIESKLPSQLRTQPLAFDTFLDAVRRATSPEARFLALDVYTDPHFHLLYRARYELYPRTVILQQVPAQDIRKGVLARTWTDWMRTARHNGASYLLVWTLPQATAHRHPRHDPWGWALPVLPRDHLPRGVVRLRDGWGLLLKAAP